MNKDISLKSKSLKLACLGKLITQNVLLVSLMIVSNAAHSASAVKGYIDRIAKVGDNYYASGWACQTGSNASIKVHLYAGGAAGAGGSYFTNGTASNNSETGVANACGSTGTNHRFKVLIPVSARSAHAGKKLYVHGISTIGSGNLAISRSGSYSIPAPPPPPAPTLSFGWYPSTIISGETTHREWSTTNADSCIGDNGSSVGTSGVSQENVQTQGKTVTMTCSGPGGSVSKSITLTVLPAIPSTPSRPSGSSSVITNQSFTISWSNVSGATSYQLYKNGSNVYSGSSTSKSQSIPASGSYSYTVKACNSTGCSAASLAHTTVVSASTVKGYIDSVTMVGNSYYANGWACQTGSNTSIQVHLYAGGAEGTGSYFTSGTASNNSGVGVANACGSTGTKHAFSVLISDSVRTAHAGKKLYVHGISTIGGNNLLISRSGTFSIPAIVSPTPTKAILISPLDGSTLSESICFDWEPATNTEYYSVQVSSDTNFDQYSKRWVLRDLDSATTSACWSSNFFANPTAVTTPESLPNGTYYWRIKSMDNKTFGTPAPNSNFTEHWEVTVLGAAFAGDAVVVGQAMTINGLNSSVSYCVSSSETAVQFNYDPTTSTATFYSASDSLLNDWQCFDESEALIQTFSAPITVNKLPAPLNLKEQNNE